MSARRPLGYATVQILKAIEAGHRYGLDIAEQTGRPTGTVYPTLGRLQKRGLIRPRWEDQRVADREGRPRRRYYELTPQGSEALRTALERFATLTRKVTHLEDGLAAE